MSPVERLRVTLLWNIAGPLLTASSGYLSWSRLGMGEDLPLEVFRQWRQWSRNPTFWFADRDIGEGMHAAFDRITVPVTAVTAIDDAWTPPKSRDAFHMAGYRNAPLRLVEVVPQEWGMSSIGHMGYFRAHARDLWDWVLRDLDEAQS
jgi:predicted alpha/beta hydrolase